MHHYITYKWYKLKINKPFLQSQKVNSFPLQVMKSLLELYNCFVVAQNHPQSIHNEMDIAMFQLKSLFQYISSEVEVDWEESMISIYAAYKKYFNVTATAKRKSVEKMYLAKSAKKNQF